MNQEEYLKKLDEKQQNIDKLYYEWDNQKKLQNQFIDVYDHPKYKVFKDLDKILQNLLCLDIYCPLCNKKLTKIIIGRSMKYLYICECNYKYADRIDNY